MNLKEKLYDLKDLRKKALDAAKTLLLSGADPEGEEYKAKTAEVDRLNAVIAATEALISEEEKGGDEVARKSMKAAAMGAGEPQPGRVDAVKAFADAARAGFPATKAAGDTMNEGADGDGGYTVPQDIVTRVEEYRESKASLRQLVTVESVTTLSGRRTFKKRSQQTGFTLVGEGGKLPKKTSPQFEIKPYSVRKYGGFFAVTNELLEDSDENITNVLVKWIGDEARVTDNTLILAAINQKAKTDLVDLDGIKRALYVDLDAAFHSTAKIVTNADGVFWLSTLKDNNGRDLLTPIPSQPGKMQLAIGAKTFPVEEFPNADLPTSDNKVPFILGDLKEGVHLFDRRMLTLTTSNVAVAGDFNAFEQDMSLTKATERLDVRQWDGEAYINGYIDVSEPTE